MARAWNGIRAFLDKDIHESRLLILGLLLLSAIARSMQSMAVNDRYLLSFSQCAPGLLVVLWGATNGDPRSKGRPFERAHLPVSAFQLWLVSFGLPAAILSIVAWLFAALDSATYANADAIASTGMNGAPALLGLFAFTYFISSISSQRLALVIGVLATVTSPAVTQSVGWGSSTLFTGAAVGFSMLTLLSIALRGIVRADIVRAIVVALPVTAVAVILVVKTSEAVRNQAHEPFVPHTYTSDTKAITVKVVGPGSSSQNVGEFRDLRTKETFTHRFKAGWHAAWVCHDRIAYVLESDTVRRDARITSWDVKSGRIRTVVRLPLRPDLGTLCEGGHFASVDPTGRYMIARLAGVQNSSSDLWLIDLKRGKRRVVIQNAAYTNPSNARWLRRRVLVPSYRSRIIEIRLPAEIVDGRAG